MYRFHRRSCRWAMLAFSVIAVTACGANVPLAPEPVQLRQLPPELQADAGPVVQGNNAFALDLYQALAARAESSGKNLFLSPYSISTALAMTWAGARTQTEAEMGAVLHFPFPQDRLHPVFGALQRSLDTGSGLGGYQLSLANRLWGQTGRAWLESFLAVTRDHYGAGLDEIDFVSDPEAARQLINAWVEEKIEGRIEELLQPPDVTSLTTLVLTNAIYFKGQWAARFDGSKTAWRPFSVSASRQVQVPTMQQTGKFRFAESADLKVLELPYMGSDLSMFLLLPNQPDALGEVEHALTPENLAAWTSGLSEREVEIQLPRFSFTSRFGLKQTLSAMGMPSAFSEPGHPADFSGMDGGGGLGIGEVIHQAFVNVDEEGTEAAAATAVVVVGTAMPQAFHADHPFVFFIRDNVTGSVLFLGRVVDPSV